MEGVTTHGKQTKMKLYEIPQLWRDTLDNIEIDEETGEILYSEEQFNLVENIQEKLANTAMYIKEEQVKADNLSDQIKRLQARKKSIESKSDWLKKMMLLAMQETGFNKVKTAEITVSSRTSTNPVYSTDIDFNRLKPDYLKVSYDLNKTAIRDAIKANDGNVPADLSDVVTMESKTSLFIKA